LITAPFLRWIWIKRNKSRDGPAPCGQSERELELLTRRHVADRAAAEKAITIAREKVGKASEKIENFLVTAPISGRILSLKIPNNRNVSAHQELGTQADLSSQIVELNVAPGQTERFGIGTAVTISLGQAEYAGEIAYIAPRAEQGTDGAERTGSS